MNKEFAPPGARPHGNLDDLDKGLAKIIRLLAPDGRRDSDGSVE